MIDAKKVIGAAEKALDGGELFLVEVNVSPANEIEVVVDCDTNVDIDACVSLSRAIEEAFDREAEDFELTVTSAGVGRPLKMLRQYKKLLGKSVEVVLKDGIKIIATLDAADEGSITLTYPEKVAVEGTKRKQTVETTKTYALDQVKTTAEYLDFK